MSTPHAIPITITLPSFTVSWVDGDPAEGVNAIESFDLIIDEPCPQELCAFLGRKAIKTGSNMLAWVDKLRDTGAYRWTVPGLLESQSNGREGECGTLEEAQAEVLRLLGVNL